ncbi:hypothetical protein K491DRAFT_585319, partial [Lophiostoma macrostomum CBS 122681]
PTFEESIDALYNSIRHRLDTEEYIDEAGYVFNQSGHRYWQVPLKKDVLILDIDTRKPNGKNELWNKQKLNWESLESMMSASFMNHFLYSRIHGYDYKFFNAAHMPNHYDTWIKPHILSSLLQSYRFVIFIDADATIQHLSVPLEWLFNRWSITPTTSIAMPVDTKIVVNGDAEASCDSKGRTVLNTGFIVVQRVGRAMEMLDAWAGCTGEERYRGCGRWREEWSHEQRAFSEYVRYEFGGDGAVVVSILEIPCDDAMGYPGLFDLDWVLTNCTGQFIRHHTLDKGMAIRSANTAMLQSMAEVMQSALLSRKDDFWVSEDNGGWLSKFTSN